MKKLIGSRHCIMALALKLICIIPLAGCGGSSGGSGTGTHTPGWTHPSSLSDNISPDGSPAFYPKAAMDGSGAAIVAWEQRDGANNQIFMSEYRNGNWTHPADLNDNISPDGRDVSEGPRAAMDGSGNALVVWHQADGTGSKIFMSEYRGGSWTHPSTVTDNISTDGQDASNPQVAMDGSGNAIIVWEQYDGADWQIYMSEYR